MSGVSIPMTVMQALGTGLSFGVACLPMERVEFECALSARLVLLEEELAGRADGDEILVAFDCSAWAAWEAGQEWGDEGPGI